MRLDIGLIGATGIAERAIITPSRGRDDTVVRAVAASDLDRATEFAATHDIQHVYNGYASLLRDPSINTVYVSLHNSAHHEWAVRAAEHGKHVIVEKPLCLRAEEFADIKRAATDVAVVVAIPTAGHPWQAAVREMIETGAYGSIWHVETNIQLPPPAAGSYRTRPELGGGIFFDCASYWLQAMQATVGLADATGHGESAFDGPNGTDTEFHATLSWPDVEATLECAVGDQHLAEIEFVFEHAIVRVHNLLRPTVTPLPLNLVIKGPQTEVRAFPPIAYYDAQLDRIHAAIEHPAGELDAAGERITLMAAIYATARQEALAL